jgi:hypothetical protein
VRESLQRRRSWLRFLLAYFGEVFAARLHPNQIEDELHFGHPTSAVLVRQGYPAVCLRTFSSTQGNGFVLEKHAAGISIQVPAALDPNWATEMPSQPIKSNAYARRDNDVRLRALCVGWHIAAASFSAL